MPSNYSENSGGDKPASIVGTPQYRSDYYKDWKPEYVQGNNPYLPPHIANRLPPSPKPPKAHPAYWTDAKRYIDDYYLMVALPFELHTIDDGRVVILNKLYRPIWVTDVPADGERETVWLPVGGPRDISEEAHPAVAVLHPELADSEREFSFWRLADRAELGTDALIASIEEQCRDQGIPVDDPRPALLAEWYRELAEESADRPGAREARADGFIIDRRTPRRTAEDFVALWMPNLIRREEEWHSWDGCAYQLVPPDELRRELIDFLSRCEHYVKVGSGKAATMELARFEPARADLDEVTTMLKGIQHVAVEDHDWLPPKRIHDVTFPRAACEPERRDILAMQNGLVHIPSGSIHPPTPAFFVRGALDFDYDPSAPEPVRWLRHLNEMWPEADEKDNIEALQLWFGYLISGETTQEKGLWLTGPPRSGKGTILLVSSWLVGEKNVASPSLASLSKTFGFQPLLGKTLATVSDLRIDKRHTDMAMLTENLLRLTACDQIDVDRKHDTSETGKRLSARLQVASNDGFPIQDASGAVASRFIYLRSYPSWLGREDTGLKEAVRAELPSILRWAIDGRRKYRARGDLLQSERGKEELEAARGLNSPMLAFLQEEAIMSPEEWTGGWTDAAGVKHRGCVDKDVLCAAFRSWYSARRPEPCNWTKIYILQQLYGTPFGIQPKKRGPKGNQQEVITGLELCHPKSADRTLPPMM